MVVDPVGPGEVVLANVDPAVPTFLGGLHGGELRFDKRPHQVRPEGSEHPLLAVRKLEGAQGARRGPAVSVLGDPDQQFDVPADNLPYGPGAVRGDQYGLSDETGTKPRRHVVELVGVTVKPRHAVAWREDEALHDFPGRAGPPNV